MKRLFIICIIYLMSAGHSYSQSPIPGMFPADRFIVDLFTDIWQNQPSGMSTNTLNRGINISMFQDFPLRGSSFSFAAGLGFTGHNLYSDHLYEVNIPNGEYFDFYQIDETIGGIRKNKISLNYLNIPLEFRFRSRTIPRVFRVSAGFRTGVLVNAHTKHHFRYEGDVFPPEVKFKQHQLENINTFQFGVTGRIGYGRVNLYGYMPLNNIFDGNTVEDMSPVSVGITLIIY